MNIVDFPLPVKFTVTKFTPVYITPPETADEEPINKDKYQFSRFRAAVAEKKGQFTSYDFDGFTMKSASQYLTLMRRKGLIKKLERKIYGKGKPVAIYTNN